MNSFSIVLIEDEPSHAILMDYHLKQLTTHVSLYTSGHAYLQANEPIATQLIIISDQLQDENILHFMTELEKRNPIPVLIMTTGREEQIQSKVHNIQYLHKPFSVQEFRQSVVSLLDHAFSTTCQ